jgi:hypothetical protein
MELHILGFGCSRDASRTPISGSLEHRAPSSEWGRCDAWHRSSHLLALRTARELPRHRTSLNLFEDLSIHDRHSLE